jgi:bifunctional N-acetylglucosamine-1-phosphate-uridyltransferase/glucosamine-1-phosphate-acetyltransferase GlmU-like protein
MYDDLSVIIPAASPGKRMKTYGPRCLLNINGRTILTQQIELVRKNFPGCQIFVVGGFEIERVKKFIDKDINLINNKIYTVLIIHGDLLFNNNTLTNLPLQKSFALIDSKKMIKKEEIGVIVQNDSIYNFEYGLPTKWGQIVFLTGNELELFEDIILHPRIKRHYLFEILNKMLDRGGELKAIEPEGMKIAEIDSSKDIISASYEHFSS